MGKNIGPSGRAWGKILGQCVLYKGVGPNFTPKLGQQINNLSQIQNITLQYLISGLKGQPISMAVTARLLLGMRNLDLSTSSGFSTSISMLKESGMALK